MKNSCKSCIYCIPLADHGSNVLVCANNTSSPCRLTLTQPQNSCNNHKKTKTVNRPTVTQPEDSQIRLIPLTQGKVAVVDAEDYDWLIQYKWHTNKKPAGFYAATHIGTKLIYMHRLIMGVPAGLVVDHIDGNSLNNTNANLRICTPAQNHYNQRPRPGSSKYKGVYWHKQQKSWAATIEKNDKQLHLGYFNNEHDAAMAYDEMARKLFGDFAYLNFAEPQA